MSNIHFYDIPASHTGTTSRCCNSSGDWEIADVKQCWSFAYQDLEQVHRTGIVNCNPVIYFITLQGIVNT